LTDAARICSAALGDLVGLSWLSIPIAPTALSRIVHRMTTLSLGPSGPTQCLGLSDSVVLGGDHLLQRHRSGEDLVGSIPSPLPKVLGVPNQEPVAFEGDVWTDWELRTMPLIGGITP
jgi:hypothetical protein